MSYRNHRVCVTQILLVVLLSLCRPLVSAADQSVSGTLKGQTIWSDHQSPVLIDDWLLIPEASVLEIRPGVEIHLAPGAGIRVEGELKARGSREQMIRFLPRDPDQYWGNIRFMGPKDTLTYDDSSHYVDGSILEYCLFVQGGAVNPDDYNGGAVFCFESSPTIQNCTFRHNRAPRGGAIACYNFASPLIYHNVFEDNASTLDDGGAICTFFYSNPLILENFLVSNRAVGNGGGIYISASNALILRNALIDNQAEAYGGGLYLSKTISRIEENALVHNRGYDESGTIYLVADAEPMLRGNSFSGEQSALYLDNVKKDVDARENWWQSLDVLEVEMKIRQVNRGAGMTEVNYLPMLTRPPKNLLTQPVELEYLKVKTDRTWEKELRFDLCHDSRVYVEVKAQDRNPYARDETSAYIYPLGGEVHGFELLLKETDLNSGIFRGAAFVRDETNPQKREIGLALGDTLAIRSSVDPDFNVRYRISEHMPFVDEFRITSDLDITHIVEHRLELYWNYFDLLKAPQQQVHIQIAGNLDFNPVDIWDSGDLNLTDNHYRVNDVILQDGARYFIRLTASNGVRYGPPAMIMVRNDNDEYSFRMNSLPEVPQLRLPGDGAIVQQAGPLLSVTPREDLERDTLIYEVEVFRTHQLRDRIYHDQSQNPDFQVAANLTENQQFWWRARCGDGYEHTNWSPVRSFYVNAQEEPPAMAGLLEPFGEVYPVRPEFLWNAAADPDPLARVTYRVELSNTGGFSDAIRMEAGENHHLISSETLKNRLEYFWRVIARDNSGLETISKIGKFRIETTPSSPIPRFPVAGEELLAREPFRLTPAVDPDPGDQLLYQIQISATADFQSVLAFGNEISDVEHFTPLDLSSWSKLSDNGSYYWRVRAIDPHRATSPWSSAEPFVLNVQNDSPNPLVLINPRDGDVVPQSQPRFSWQPLSDPDYSDTPDQLRVQVEFSRDRQFANEMTLTQTSEAGQTEILTKRHLEDNQQWFVRFRVLDNENLASEVTGPVRLVINEQEDPPSTFVLLGPLADQAVYTLQGLEFNWQAATDPDFGSRVKYRFELATDAGFTNSVVMYDTLTAERLILPQKMKNQQTYYWRVTAMDNTGLETPCERAGHFYLDTTPTAPVVHSEAEYQATAVLKWDASTDPDPRDRLVYDLQLLDRENRQLGKLESLNATSLPVSRLVGLAALEDDEMYRCQVRARDPHGAVSSWVPFDLFHLNLENDPPAVPGSGFRPTADQQIGDVAVTISWDPVTDPDHSDPLETIHYQVLLDQQQNFSGSASATFNIPPGRTELLLNSLADNSRWYYKIRALDDEDARSSWSPVQTFIHNLKDDPPTAPHVQEPVSGARLVKLDQLSVRYQASDDPDYGAEIRYDIQIRSADGSVWRHDLVSTNAQLSPTFKTDRDYELVITATDDTGLTSQSEVVAFHVTTTPGVPQVIGGTDPREINHHDRISWSRCNDPDPDDRITYRVQFSETALFRDMVWEGTTEATELQVPSALQENQDYFWRVQAEDSHTIRSAWSQDIGRVIMNDRNEAPVIAGPIELPVSPSTTTSINVQWPMAKDPDWSDQENSLIPELKIQVRGGPAATPRMNAGSTRYTLKLDDNQVYQISYRYLDDEGAASPWSSAAALTVNRQPDAPRLPDNALGSLDQLQNRTRLTLNWQCAQDPDPDDTAGKLRYEIEVLDSGSGHTALSRQVTGDCRTTINVADNSRLQVRLRALDPGGLSTPWQQRDIVVNVQNDPPAAPVVSARWTAAGIVVSWNRVTDPDPGDEVSYRVSIATDAGMSRIVHSETLADDRYSWVPQDIKGDGYVTVTSRDENGSETTSSVVRVIAPGAP